MSYLNAFLLTLFAGLSTGIGGLLAFHKKAASKNFLTFALGFSAGVMIYVSFVEILPKAIESLQQFHSESRGYILATVAFFVGIGFIAIIDLIIPSRDNPHEIPDLNLSEDQKEKNNLMRMGVFSALAIAIHNFPEGLATFIAALESPALGISIAVALAIHNIPEGIAVAVPIYQATGSRTKAFLYALLSGLAEPIGALLGYFLLLTIFSDLTFGLTFAFVGGIMVYISMDELLPTSEKYGKHHLSILGLVTGMALMALSLILFV
ncbi:MAG: zinc transporter ZupT [Acholeplasmataceae bacterium]|nr:MAG: zinc transporter ZupT [Acholeplasmataceae bacterium]